MNTFKFYKKLHCWIRNYQLGAGQFQHFKEAMKIQNLRWNSNSTSNYEQEQYKSCMQHSEFHLGCKVRSEKVPRISQSKWTNMCQANCKDHKIVTFCIYLAKVSLRFFCPSLLTAIKLAMLLEWWFCKRTKCPQDKCALKMQMSMLSWICRVLKWTIQEK